MFQIEFTNEADPDLTGLVMVMDVATDDSGNARQIGNAWLDGHSDENSYPVSCLSDEGWVVSKVSRLS